MENLTIEWWNSLDKNLKKLFKTILNFNNNENISEKHLEKLTSLKVLDLRETKISTLKPFANLLNLESINLDFSYELKKLDALKNYPNLQYLSLNNIQNSIQTMPEMLNLKHLEVNNGEFLDILFLKNVPNIQYLSLRNNRNLTNISALENLKSLKYLDLGNCVLLKDLSFLKNLTNLVFLNIEYVPVNDISFLKNLINIAELNISCIDAEDINVIENLPNLKSLNLASCHKVKEVSFLEKMAKLTNLNVSYAPLNNLDFIKKIPHIHTLDISTNHIIDFSGLHHHNYLTSLNMTNSIKITTEKMNELVEKLPNLIILQISGDHIEDFSALYKHKKLTWINEKPNNQQTQEHINYTRKDKFPLGNNIIIATTDKQKKALFVDDKLVILPIYYDLWIAKNLNYILAKDKNGKAQKVFDMQGNEVFPTDYEALTGRNPAIFVVIFPIYGGFSEGYELDYWVTEYYDANLNLKNMK